MTKSNLPKMLVYENPVQHSCKIASCLLRDLDRDFELDLAKNVGEASSKLSSSKFDLVFVHHGDFDDIIELRKKHPNVKYAGYSGAIDATDKKGSIGAEMIDQMKKHYDFLLFRFDIYYMRTVLKAKKII